MSHAHAQCRFPDGLILHFEYNGTGDFCTTALRRTEVEVSEHWRADNEAECRCGQPSEPVELTTIYGRGFRWHGKACRGCMAIVGGRDPYPDDDEAGEAVDGVADWWKEWPAI